MSGISHQQAMEWIHRRLDGLLDQEQGLSLDEHLRACKECSAYGSQMELLPLHLRHEFHIRWDKKPGPSYRVMEYVTTQASNIPATNRFSSSMRLIAGAMTLVILGVAINFVIGRLQSTNAATTATKIVDSAPLPEDRLLAFASDQNGIFDIYTMHADGTGLTNLTNNPALDSSPIWSPDGKHIAFESDRDGFVQIYLMDANGSNIIQLTNDEADHKLPLNRNGTHNPWSPDGSRLLFVQEAEGEMKSLYSIDINSENKITLANGRISLYDVSWSPGGKHIAYFLDVSPTPDNYVPNLYVVEPDGSNVRELKKLLPAEKQSDFLYTYYWSSNGQSIFLPASARGSVREAIYQLDLQTNTFLNETETKLFIEDWREGVSLIKDINQEGMPYVWERSDGTRNTFEASKAWDTTYDPSIASAAPCSLDFTRSTQNNFAFGVYCPDSRFNLYWTNPDGSIIKQLLTLPTDVDPGGVGDIVWSPDDQYMAFNLVSSDKTEMYVVNVEESLANSSSQPLHVSVSTGKGNGIPSWQPILIPKVADNLSEVKIDPQSCKAASDLNSTLQPPNDLHGYELIQGTSFVDGDFSYEFWLYCDPALKPSDQEHFSSVAGLGVYSSWRYTGPSVEGTNQYYFEFEPNVPVGTTSWNGPLNKAAATGAKFGVNVSEETIRANIQEKTPFQFRAVIDSPLGHNGANLSFSLEPTERGYRIANVQTGSLHPFGDGLIAFTAAGENGNLDIFTVHADGSGLVNLTNNAANDDSPAWSPDGRQVAFVSNREGNEDIYVMNADGSNLTRLTENPGSDIVPLWSPDGTRIAYGSRTADGKIADIYVMDSDGQYQRRLTNNAPGPNAIWPEAWSPDGESIYFYTNQKIVKIKVDTGDITPITPQSDIPYQFALSNDGSTLLYLVQCGEHSAEFCNRVKTIQTDGTQGEIKDTVKLKQICTAEETSSTKIISSYYMIKWSPDRTKILFAFHCEEDGGLFYIANADGSDFKPLTNVPLFVKGPAFDWSPDSQSIIFSAALDGSQNELLYVLRGSDALQHPELRSLPLSASISQVSSFAWQPLP